MGKYSIIGGDMRCRYMAEYLEKMGNEVKCLKVQGENHIATKSKEKNIIETNNTEKNNSGKNIKIINDINEADGVLILPVPVSKDGENIFINVEQENDKKTANKEKVNKCQIENVVKSENSRKYNIKIEDIIKHLPNVQAVYGGVIPIDITEACKQQNIICYDFMKDDEVACKNAVATAEGAILEAFALSNINISGSKSLVTGFGRCAKAIAFRLMAWDSKVTIMARTIEACKEAEAMGYSSILLKPGDIAAYNGWKDFDFCYNTIPAFVLDHHILSRFSRRIVVIDIASKPGGTDFDYCEQEGISFKHCLGIPGKYSPETSGDILAEAVLKKITEN